MLIIDALGIFFAGSSFLRRSTRFHSITLVIETSELCSFTTLILKISAIMKHVSKSTLVFKVAIIQFFRNSDIIFAKGTQIFSENSLTVRKSGNATSIQDLSASICFISSIFFSLLSIHKDFLARLNVPSSSSRTHFILNVFFDLNFLSQKLSNP